MRAAVLTLALLFGVEHVGARTHARHRATADQGPAVDNERIHLPDASERSESEPGKCSICGMTLVPGDPMATADYAITSPSNRAR